MMKIHGFVLDSRGILQAALFPLIIINFPSCLIRMCEATAAHIIYCLRKI